MAWHDSWAIMKKKPQPQGQTRRTGAAAKRETRKSTAAKGRKTPPLNG